MKNEINQARKPSERKYKRKESQFRSSYGIFLCVRWGARIRELKNKKIIHIQNFA
jgi:hypothetical protein